MMTHHTVLTKSCIKRVMSTYVFGSLFVFYGAIFSMDSLSDKAHDQHVYALDGQNENILDDNSACLFCIVRDNEHSEQQIKELLLSGVDPNIKTLSEGYSPLHCAKRVSTARALVKHGAVVDSTCNKGRTPLWMSMFDGTINVPLSHFFVRHGADVNHANAKNRTIIEQAILKSRPDVIKIMSQLSAQYFVEVMIDMNKQIKGTTTLLELIQNHSCRDILVPFFIKYDFAMGGCIDTIRDRGVFELEEDDLYRIATLLLMLRQQKERKSSDGIFINKCGYLFQNACLEDLKRLLGERDFAWIINYINNHCKECLLGIVNDSPVIRLGWKFFVFHYDQDIAFQGFNHFIVREKECGWPFPVQTDYPYLIHGKNDYNGATLLHNAVTCYHKTAIKFFINYGINFMAKNDAGKTPYDIAKKTLNVGQLDYVQKIIITYLLNKHPHNIAPELKSFFSCIPIDPVNQLETPLLIEVAKYYPRWVSVLLEQKPDVNVKDMHGKTALDYVVHNQNQTIALLLLGDGALVEKDLILQAKSELLRSELQQAYNSQNPTSSCDLW